MTRDERWLVHHVQGHDLAQTRADFAQTLLRLIRSERNVAGVCAFTLNAEAAII